MTNRRSTLAAPARGPARPLPTPAPGGSPPPGWGHLLLQGILPRALVLAGLVVGSTALGACADKQPCEVLVEQLCGLVGGPGCDRLKATPPTDAEACAAVLADDVALTRQVDALKAASIALEVEASKKAAAPAAPTKAAEPSDPVAPAPPTAQP